LIVVLFHSRLSSRPYSIGSSTSFAICSTLRLFACFDVSVREDYSLGFICFVCHLFVAEALYMFRCVDCVKICVWFERNLLVEVCTAIPIWFEIVLLVEVSSVVWVLSVFGFSPQSCIGRFWNSNPLNLFDYLNSIVLYRDGYKYVISVVLLLYFHWVFGVFIANLSHGL
jgi:hypothetical protein